MSLPIIFGNLSDRTEVSLPYFGILYRPGWLKSKNFYLEFELGYFKLQSNFLTTENPNVIPSPLILEESESHNFPLTLSIGYHLDLNDWFALNPKLGLGYMFTYNKTKLRGD
ncbi:MAG TPA: hypothetical protein ENI73_06355, partial [Spirochaetes bacterium]|nr:hypothetical protein [Spirochaetota bacterium]